MLQQYNIYRKYCTSLGVRPMRRFEFYMGTPKIIGITWRAVTIEVDGYEFVDCQFRGCVIKFAALSSFKMTKCRFDSECTFIVASE